MDDDQAFCVSYEVHVKDDSKLDDKTYFHAMFSSKRLLNSIDRNPTNVNCKKFHFHPILETKEWKNAYSWIKSGPIVVQAEQEGDYQLYFIKSSTAGDFTLNKSFITKKTEKRRF